MVILRPAKPPGLMVSIATLAAVVAVMVIAACGVQASDTYLVGD